MAKHKAVEEFKQFLQHIEQFEKKEPMTDEERGVFHHFVASRLGASFQCFLSTRHCKRIAELTHKQPIRRLLSEWKKQKIGHHKEGGCEDGQQ